MSNQDPTQPQTLPLPEQAANMGGQIDVAALRETPDTALLRPDILRAVGDVNTASQAAEAAHTAGDQATEQLISDAHDTARRSILGPEQAVAQARAINLETARRTVEDLDRISATYHSMTESGGVPRGLSQIVDQLPQVKGLLRELQGVADGHDQLQDYQVARVRQLQDFVADYRLAIGQTMGYAEDTQSAANRGFFHVEETQAQLVSGARRVREEIDATIASPDLSRIDETVQQVSERGAGTVGEHVASCGKDITGEEESADSAARATGPLLEHAYSVRGAVLRLKETVEGLPGYYALDSAADWLSQIVTGHKYSGRPLRDLWEPVQELQRAIARIEQGAEDINGSGQRIAYHADQAGTAARQLRSLPLFERAS